MTRLLILCSMLFVINTGYGQQLSQTIRGKVVDAETYAELIGVNILLMDDLQNNVGTVSDENGNFRFNNVPIGRHTLQFSYIGYNELVKPNIVLNSSKEVVLDIGMIQSTLSIDEVVVSGSKNKGQTNNEMVLISGLSISPEETNRYAGGFNDPSRILSNFAGITSTQDGSNDIIVRGNSPKYVQWRLEGIQIPNPNHFGDQSSVGGSISLLNNNLLTTSDFNTGAFVPEYGDVLSGVYDLKLRSGNNEKFEGIFGFGLLGTDLTLEGPLSKICQGASYIVNYRYSNIGLAKDLRLIELTNGVLNFQDAAFKLSFPTKKIGVFSLFGIGGKSGFEQKDVTPDFWQSPNGRTAFEGIKEDYNKSNFIYNAGLTHTINLGKETYLKTSLSYSTEKSRDEVYELMYKVNKKDGTIIVTDTLLSNRLNFNGKWNRNTYRAAMTLNHRINAKHFIQAGSRIGFIQNVFDQSRLNDANERISLVQFDKGMSNLSNFFTWKYKPNEKLTFVSGLHNFNVFLNQKSTLEPRFSLALATSSSTTFSMAYGHHSTMESVHHYFALVKDKDGTLSQVNKDLGLLKAHHIVIGFEKRWARHFSAKIETYFQSLYNLPVENLDTSSFATINEGLDFRYLDLVNKGTGKNYGIELTINKYLNKGFYFMANGSIYQSKYEALDGKERNSRFNGNYLINFLVGKEFTQLGKKKNQVFAINAKAFMGGGRKIIPLLRDANGKLDVDPVNGQFWDYNKAYGNDLEDAFQVNLSFSYKWNKLNKSHELFINIDNVTDHKGKITEYYDEEKPGLVGHQTQFGIFPNLMYRLYF